MCVLAVAETQIVTCVNWTDFTGKKDTGISDVTESRLRCPDSFLGTTVIHTAEEETGSCGGSAVWIGPMEPVGRNTSTGSERVGMPIQANMLTLAVMRVTHTCVVHSHTDD